jgi:hypothetical protein
VTAGRFNALGGQEADLPMPGAGMGITLYAMILNEKGLIHDLLPGSLFLADGNGDNFHHSFLD